VARDAAKAGVRVPLTHGVMAARVSSSAISFIRFAHSVSRRFHSAEFLDALSVLPKDAERQRRQAASIEKHAE